MYKEKLKEIISYPYQAVHSFKKELFKKNILKKKRLVVPVISVGNISFGGTGKTPFTIYLAKTLIEKYKKNVCILTRAYKSKIPKSKIPLYINSKDSKKYLKEDAKYFIGDEPLLLLEKFQKEKKFSLAISSNRYQAAVKALKKNPNIDLFILDDAMQHLDLYKDFEIALVNILEKGFYRENSEALNEVDQVIYSKVDYDWLSQEENKDKIALNFKLALKDYVNPHKKIMAISALADNESFFKMIRQKLHEISYVFKKDEEDSFYCVSLPDHYVYSQSDIEHFIKKSSDYNLICTAKDYVKIPKIYQDYFIVAELDLEVHNEASLLSKLMKLL